MTANDYWKLFMENGAPEVYLLYQQALKMEGGHVSDHKGPGLESYGLQ